MEGNGKVSARGERARMGMAVERRYRIDDDYNEDEVGWEGAWEDVGMVA